jgi:hypothetical protein
MFRSYAACLDGSTVVVLKHQGFCANGKRLFLNHKRKQKEQKRQKCSPSARACYSRRMFKFRIAVENEHVFVHAFLESGSKSGVMQRMMSIFATA